MFKLLVSYIRAYRNKISNRIFGVVHIKHAAKKKGVVLVSFSVTPFLLTPRQFLSDPHSHNWVCPEIVRVFTEMGYDVDVIDWKNHSFRPKKNYAACFDIHDGLERFSKRLPSSCVKIQFTTGSQWKFQNEAEDQRIKEMRSRKGASYPPARETTPSNFERYADHIIGYGNKTVLKTFSLSGDKKIIPLHAPAMEEYDFPDKKDFSETRKSFLWFGGGGLVLKGLDLVLDAFAALPNLHLTIIGPVAYEAEFEKIYHNELALPNVTRYGRPRKISYDSSVKLGDAELFDILKTCGAVLGMSASEGCSGAVLQAMEAGIFPIITPNTGIDEEAPSIVLHHPTAETIQKTVREFSEISPEKLKELSLDTWRFMKSKHTKENFTKEMTEFIREAFSEK